jgi:hypothetical protein
LTTAVGVAPASQPDGPQAKDRIDGQPEARRPNRVLGDTGYGTDPVRAELAERDVEVLAPVPAGTVRDGRFAKNDFEVDLEAATVTRPAGQIARIRTEPSGRRRATSPSASATPGPGRPRIERLLGLLAVRYGARKRRYFGRRKARLQAA